VRNSKTAGSVGSRLGAPPGGRWQQASGRSTPDSFSLIPITSRRCISGIVSDRFTRSAEPCGGSESPGLQNWAPAKCTTTWASVYAPWHSTQTRWSPTERRSRFELAPSMPRSTATWEVDSQSVENAWDEALAGKPPSRRCGLSPQPGQRRLNNLGVTLAARLSPTDRNHRLDPNPCLDPKTPCWR